MSALFAVRLATAAAPAYTPASVVNAATNLPGPLAPNAMASVYGTNLCYNTRGLSQEDVHSGMLPTLLPGTGVRVLIDDSPVPLLFVSPKQINFLVPSNLKLGRHLFAIALNGLYGPTVEIVLSDASPGFFQLDAAFVIATHASGALLTPDAPAQPSEVIVLYATGLGETVPKIISGALALSGAEIAQRARLEALLNGTRLDSSAILYAGLTPGFAGLYQVNLRLPDILPADPEIRLQVGEQGTPQGLKLYVRQP